MIHLKLYPFIFIIFFNLNCNSNKIDISKFATELDDILEYKVLQPPPPLPKEGKIITAKKFDKFFLINETYSEKFNLSKTKALFGEKYLMALGNKEFTKINDFKLEKIVRHSELNFQLINEDEKNQIYEENNTMNRMIIRLSNPYWIGNDRIIFEIMSSLTLKVGEIWHVIFKVNRDEYRLERMEISKII